MPKEVEVTMIARWAASALLAVTLVALATGALAMPSATGAPLALSVPNLTFEPIATGVADVKAAVKYQKGSYALDLEKATIPVGDFVPWHCHPGPTTFIVVQGELTTFAPDGSSNVLGVGDADVEQIGTARESENLGTEDVIVYIQFSPPEGLPNTIWLSGPDAKCKY
jgi:quercetin dioxygenase-like cupin family protein